MTMQTQGVYHLNSFFFFFCVMSLLDLSCHLIPLMYAETGFHLKRYKLLTTLYTGFCVFFTMYFSLTISLLAFVNQVSFWRRKIPKPEWANSGWAAFFCAAAGQFALQHPTSSSTEGECCFNRLCFLCLTARLQHVTYIAVLHLLD